MRGALAGGKSVRKNYGRQYVCRPYIFELPFFVLYLLAISRLYSSFDNLEILREAVLSL